MMKEPMPRVVNCMRSAETRMEARFMVTAAQSDGMRFSVEIMVVQKM